MANQASRLVHHQKACILVNHFKKVRHWSILVSLVRATIIRSVNEKRNLWLPIALMLVFAITRWPGVLPPNFSAVYALIFCAGVYLPPRLWWLPFATMVATDVALNIYYSIQFGVDSFRMTQLVNYAVYVILLGLGRKLGPHQSFRRLLGGGILGALLFYVVTNTASWLFNPFQNPEYTKNLAGWWIALTKGTGGYMQTWEFFRNTLLSGGLFTGLFVASMKISASAESPLDKEPETGEKPADEPVADEA
jgi:hypothetical protein